jgi:hypothetical protein
MDKKNNFTGVDVWRPSFGPVSVKAIYELYRTKTNCSQKEFDHVSFREMVEYLRTQGNPTI